MIGRTEVKSLFLLSSMSTSVCLQNVFKILSTAIQALSFTTSKPPAQDIVYLWCSLIHLPLHHWSLNPCLHCPLSACPIHTAGQQQI
ncbi:hypothetical protein B0H16DRAFT_1581469 [Mycena metata]|uniref:Uncharacterized protein n=1 Tax=Mycena metata TaxID=1033252 RepID=A0AAD7MUA1_9AGAR|nr:hypothetical protein B0H16DRAFT_1581469 [Mycena metata]